MCVKLMHAVSYCLLQPLAACSIDAWTLLQVQLALAMLLLAFLSIWGR